MRDRLDRLTAAIERLAAALETARAPDPVAAALRQAYPAGVAFTAADALAEAARQAAQAAALGQAAPPLPAALDAAGIRSCRALGRRLPAVGAVRVGRDGQGALWCFTSTPQA